MLCLRRALMVGGFPASRFSVTLITVTVTLLNVTPHGESLHLRRNRAERRVRGPRGRARPSGGGSQQWPEGVSHLPAPLRQVVARPSRAAYALATGGAHRQSDCEQLQLVRRLSRGFCQSD